MKAFKKAAVMSLATERMIGGFADMHELIEFISGRPVFTHELASEEMVLALQSELARRVPYGFADEVTAVLAAFESAGAGGAKELAERLAGEWDGVFVEVAA